MILSDGTLRDLLASGELVVEPIDDEGVVCGAPHAAVDVTQAGPGERVFLVGSREAALALPETFVPVDAAIVGIVDQVDVPVKF